MTEELTFTEALKKLKELSEKLDKGDVELEEAMRLYEDGVSLHKYCLEKLSKTKLKFEELNGESNES